MNRIHLETHYQFSFYPLEYSPNMTLLINSHSQVISQDNCYSILSFDSFLTDSVIIASCVVLGRLVSEHNSEEH